MCKLQGKREDVGERGLKSTSANETLLYCSSPVPFPFWREEQWAWEAGVWWLQFCMQGRAGLHWGLHSVFPIPIPSLWAWLQPRAVGTGAGAAVNPLQVLPGLAGTPGNAGRARLPLPSNPPRDWINGSHTVLIVANKCLNDLMQGRGIMKGRGKRQLERNMRFNYRMNFANLPPPRNLTNRPKCT